MQKMILADAQKCITDVFGADTKVFARADPISGNLKILRPVEEGEDTSELKGRYLISEKLVVLGQGRTWEDALREAIAPFLAQKRLEQHVRAMNAEFAGERFAVFLREKYDAEYQEWVKTSPVAEQMQKDFEKRVAEQTKEPTGARA